jgi:hypothetical protein
MNQNDIEKIKTMFEEKINNPDASSLEAMASFLMSPIGRVAIQKDKQIEMIYKFIQASFMEKEDKRMDFFLKNRSIEKMDYWDGIIRNILYRIYSDYLDDELIKMINHVLEENISVYIFLVYSGYFNENGDRVIVVLSKILDSIGEKIKSILLLNAADRMYQNNKEILVDLAKKYTEIGMESEALEISKKLGKLEESKHESER